MRTGSTRPGPAPSRDPADKADEHFVRHTAAGPVSPLPSNAPPRFLMAQTYLNLSPIARRPVIALTATAPCNSPTSAPARPLGDDPPTHHPHLRPRYRRLHRPPTMFRTVVLALALVGASAFTPSVLKTSVSRRTVTRGAMEMRTPIMAGNWKMNPPTVAEAEALAKAVGAVAEGDKVEVRERRRRRRRRHHNHHRRRPARLTTHRTPPPIKGRGDPAVPFPRHCGHGARRQPGQGAAWWGTLAGRRPLASHARALQMATHARATRAYRPRSRILICSHAHRASHVR